MKYGDLIGSVLYLLSALIWFWSAWRLFKTQSKHIADLQKMIDVQNQRHVGLLAIFQMLLKNLQDKTGTKI